MSVIDTVYSPSGQAIPIVDSQSTGFNALDAEAFLKLMIVQLQNQDPTEPTSNEQLLGQISEMRSLQASVELEKTIQLLAASQTSAATSSFTASAAGMIGRTVTAQTAATQNESGVEVPGQEISGIVDRAMLRNGKVYLGIGTSEVPIENVTRVE